MWADCSRSKDEPEAEWSTDAGWNMLRWLLNLKLFQTQKVIELWDVPPPLRLFSANVGAFRQEADKTVQADRPFFSAWHSDFPLSAFLCPAFHSGDRPQKARLVIVTVVRALVEGNRTWTEACSFPDRITVTLLASGDPGGVLLDHRAGLVTTLSAGPCSQRVSLLWGRAPEFLLYF